MFTVYEYLHEGSALSLPEGKVRLSSDFPETSLVCLKRLPYNIFVEYIKLGKEELLSLANSFFTVENAACGAYFLDIKSHIIKIYSSDEAGCFYAVQTLLSRLENHSFCELELYESPRGRRGIKLYLPPPTEEGIADFKKIVDLAARCKFDFIMLELGGALEYKNHPEINIAWCKYAGSMNSKPGRTLEVQNAFPWRKNSIHSENGGGRFLTQDLFVELAEYCRNNFLEIIPEMPSLSHSDYILAAYPGLAERNDDPYPDTCCPQNKDYHKLYFDLLDEVIELIHPKALNIGHDEFYTVNICEKCRGKDPAKLYADDINTICCYLREKNVEPFIWGEKLLDSHWQNGEPIGGAAVEATENMEALPAVHPAVELLDKVNIFHWYWTVDRKLDDVYSQHDMDYIFGNVNPVMFRDFKRRISQKHAIGCCVSNWGETSWRTLQRNGVLYDMVYMSLLMWNSRLGEDDFIEIDREVFKYLYRFCRNTKGRKQSLLLTHTVMTDIKYQYFFDGFLLDEKSFYLGDHIFADLQGDEYCFPVIFGSNISNADVFAERCDDPEGLRDAWVYNLQHSEVAGECLKSVDADKKVWYTCNFDLPDGVEKLSYKRFQAAEQYKNITVQLADYKITEN